MSKQNKRLLGIGVTVTILLLVPLIAMQFTGDVNWSLSDFVTMGILFLGTGLLCELVIRKVSAARHRLAVCGVILAALVLIWLELAVGIFGTPLAGS